MASVSQYRTMSFTWLNMERRMQWALQGYNQTQFYLRPARRRLLRSRLQPASSIAISPRRPGPSRAARAFAIYPFNRYRRVEVFGGFSRYQERYNDPLLEQLSIEYQQEQFGRSLFNNGSMMPLGAAFVQETTIFREFGPLVGQHHAAVATRSRRRSATCCRARRSTATRASTSASAPRGLLALRARGFKSWGENPDYTYFGGNSELRGYEYLSFIGQNAFFTNAELRFPLIDAMATPIGVLGGVRATLFAGLGGAHFEGTPFKVWTQQHHDRASDHRVRR